MRKNKYIPSKVHDDIVALKKQGLSNREVAEKVDRTTATVVNIWSSYKKLNTGDGIFNVDIYARETTTL